MSIQVTGMTATYQSGPQARPVVEDVAFEVPAGTIAALLGPSGSGKSTVLRCIAGLMPLVSGTVAIDGTDVTGRRPEHRRVGLVPQGGDLFPHLTVRANVEFALPRARREQLAHELMELVGVAELASRKPHEISGGQAQRVALARALAARPQAVLLDEPFSALDPGSRAEVRDEVLGVLRATGTTALVVTHDREDALSTADQVIVMGAGAVRDAGTPRDVYESPATVWSGSFVGDSVLLPGTVESGGDGVMVGCALGVFEVRSPEVGSAVESSSTVTVLVRPERLSLARGEAGAPAVVESVRFLGHDCVAQVRVAGVAVPVRCRALDAPAVDDRVSVTVLGEVWGYTDAGGVPLALRPTRPNR